MPRKTELSDTTRRLKNWISSATGMKIIGPAPAIAVEAGSPGGLSSCQPTPGDL